MPPIAENLRNIRENILRASERAGRNPAEVRIMAVTKTQSLEKIKEAAACGLEIFGENRVQEAVTKLESLKNIGNWHLIGHLQSNKAKKACEIFDSIDSIDSQRLAGELSTAATGLGRTVEVMAEVNVAGEAQKFGFAAAEAADEIARLAVLPGLKLRGLMTMAPYGAAEAVLRKTFSGLREVRAQLGPAWGALELSMGMSDDYGLAVEEGATLLRIGRALFK